MIVELSFSHGEQNLFATNAECQLKIHDVVIVRSEKCVNYAKVSRILPDTAIQTDSVILRLATEEDLAKISALEQESAEAKVIIKEVIEDQGLEMKVVDVAYSFEKTQLFVSFTAENRVDFRTLLRELASIFRTRLELRQIGVRDASKIYGGVGPCGRPLCCSEFIYEFPNVSIKMAKNQSLSLKQSKLNGLCGRLMCCLTYEDDFYREARENFPDFGDMITTEEGEGRVVGLDILANKVKVRLEDSVKEFDLKEIEGVHG